MRVPDTTVLPDSSERWEMAFGLTVLRGGNWADFREGFDIGIGGVQEEGKWMLVVLCTCTLGENYLEEVEVKSSYPGGSGYLSYFGVREFDLWKIHWLITMCLKQMFYHCYNIYMNDRNFKKIIMVIMLYLSAYCVPRFAKHFICLLSFFFFLLKIYLLF